MRFNDASKDECIMVVVDPDEVSSDGILPIARF